MTDFTSQRDYEAFEQGMLQACATFNECARQLVALVQPGLVAAGQAFRELEVTLDAQWPQWREFAASVPDYVPAPPYQGCHCFCGVVHGVGVCIGQAEPGLHVVKHLNGKRIDIPVCRDCFDARALVTS